MFVASRKAKEVRSIHSYRVETKMAATQVGWIGLGSMGIGMSKNLQKYLSSISAPPLIYTNRTLSRGESLAALGAAPVQSVGEVAKKSDIIFSCVCSCGIPNGDYDN